MRALLAALSACLAVPAWGGTQMSDCGPADAMNTALEPIAGDLVWAGVGADGALIRLYQSDDGQWMVLWTSPDASGVCIGFSGQIGAIVPQGDPA